MTPPKPTASEMLGELIRDLTAVCPEPKSLVRKKIVAFAQAVIEEVVPEKELIEITDPERTDCGEFDTITVVEIDVVEIDDILANWSDLKSKLER